MNDFWINAFLGTHILIIFAFVLSYIHRLAIQNHKLKVSPAAELNINYIMIIMSVGLPLLLSPGWTQFEFQPITKTYIASTYREFDSLPKNTNKDKMIVETKYSSNHIPLDGLKYLLLALTGCSLLFSLIKYLKELRSLNNILSFSYHFKEIGHTRIVFSDKINVPFSHISYGFFKNIFLRRNFLTPCAWIVLPICFLEDYPKLKISIFHEIQHHRHGDTKIAYLFYFIRAIFGFNPALYFWIKMLSEVQELKVDQALMDQNKVGPREYARCLISVAESAVLKESPLVSATSVAFLLDRQQLTRRIEFMIKRKVFSKLAEVLIGGILITSLTGFALTNGKAIGSRRITMTQAEDMASRFRQSSQFPIVVNELVLEQLNRYLGTAQGREFMKKSMERMEAHRSLIENKIKSYSYQMPMELIAVPLIESGYQNLHESKNPYKAAGIWQMIRRTAIIYGLKVDNTKDERLDIDLETDASLRYIMANYLRFGDWQLAMMAFNMGESKLQRAIEIQQSRDAWTLIRAGYEGDKAYLAKLIAAILILKNPSLLD